MKQKSFDVLNSGALDKACMLITLRKQSGAKGKHQFKREVQCFARLFRTSSK